jgi:hypothetical protein
VEKGAMLLKEKCVLFCPIYAALTKSEEGREDRGCCGRLPSLNLGK